MRLKVQNVSKNLGGGPWPTTLLENVELEGQDGEFITVFGESGSGKSTLFSILSLLEHPSTGSIFMDGMDVTMLDEPQKVETRLENIGMIFPSPNLIPSFSAIENVLFPMTRIKRFKGHHSERSKFLLALVDLADKAFAFPEELSLEERQRVSLARALANRPNLLLADEPTKYLDEPTGQQLLQRLRSLQQSQNLTLILFTQDKTKAKSATKTYTLKSGKMGTHH